jgi:hypothetical protein
MASERPKAAFATRNLEQDLARLVKARLLGGSWALGSYACNQQTELVWKLDTVRVTSLDTRKRWAVRDPMSSMLNWAAYMSQRACVLAMMEAACVAAKSLRC